MAKKIKMIVGSTRQGRVGLPIAQWYQNVAKENGVEVELIDLKDLELPFYEAAVPPAYMPTQTPEGKKWAAVVAEADGFIFVTAEYNRSIPAALKNAIDFLFAEWEGKPAAIVSYGYVDGGGSATNHLKDILGWVKLQVVEPTVKIPFTQELFDNGAFKDIDSALAASKADFVAALSAVNA